MTRPKRRLARRRYARSRSALGALVTLAVVVGPAMGWASWAGSGSGPSALVTAGALAVPGVPTPSQIAGGKTVSVTWAAVSGATNYVVLFHTAAIGGTTTTACTSAATSCVDPNPRASTAWYSVQALAGSGWLAESLRVAYVPDVTTSVAISALGTDTGSSGSDFITNAASNTLTGTSEAGASIVVKRGGIQIATATASGSGNWTSSSFTLAEGLQDLVVTGTDAYANTATATASNVRLDTVAPVTSQSTNCTTGNAALVGNWCKNVILTMTATFSDAGSGLQAGTSQYNDNGSGWISYVTPVSLLEANGRVVQLRATDVAGNVGPTSVTYYIDGTAPTLIVSARALCSAGTTVCGTSSDSVSGLAGIASVKWKLQRTVILDLSTGCYQSSSSSWVSCSGYGFQNSIGALPNWSSPTLTFNTLLYTYKVAAQSSDVAGNVTDVPFTAY